MKFFRKNIKWIRWIISVSFLSWLFWRTNWPQLFTQLATANILFILFATFIGFGFYFIFATSRWKTLLKAFNIPYSFTRSFELIMIGFFAGFALSDSLGAFIRGLYLKQDGYSLKTATLTIFLDKAAEILGLLGFGLAGLFMFSAHTTYMWLGFGIFGGIGILAIMFVWLWWSQVGIFISQGVDRWLNNRFQWLGDHPATNLHQQMTSVSFNIWLQVTGFTILRRLAHYGAVYMLALSISIPVSYFDIVVVMSLVGIAVVLPLAVAGGLGVREGILASIFVVLGYPKEAAISLALLIFISSLVWRGIGFIVWLRNPLATIPIKLGVQDSSGS